VLLDAVEQVPEDFGLANESLHTRVLQIVGVGLAHHESNRFFRIAARARDARSEIAERLLVDPGVVPLPRGDSLGHQIGREELGERRSDRHHEWALLDKHHVAVASEPNPGEHIPATCHPLAVEPNTDREAKPLLEPTGLGGAVSIVIVNSSNLRAPKNRIVALGKDQRILDGDPRLVIEAVQDPALQTLAIQLALVHAHVHRVLVVVPLRPLAA